MGFLEKIKEFKNKLLKIKNTKSIINNKFCYKNSTTTRMINSSCTLKFSTDSEIKNKKIHDNLKKILKKYVNNPEKLIQYIKLQGINVYQIKGAKKLLSKIKEETGFLTPLKGKKAFIINLLVGLFCENKLKLSFYTKEMFIFESGNIEIYTLARALYKYYGYKYALPGYDYYSQELYKKVYGDMSVKISNMSLKLEDMYACKEALARNMEAINFTLEFSLENERAKNALKKISKEEVVKI